MGNKKNENIGSVMKNFFKKKKMELTFQRAGPGQRLNAETPKPTAVSTSSASSAAPPRVEMSEESRTAAAAALARLESKSSTSPRGFASSSSYRQMKSEVNRDMVAESSTKRNSMATGRDLTGFNETTTSLLATQGVYFKCPLISDEILSKAEWTTRIREYLDEMAENEKGLAACLIIKNCNKNRDKIDKCIETLCKYLQNIKNNPNEEKYRRIRLSNKVFREKVSDVEGAIELLKAAGFEKEHITVNEQPEEFLVFSEDRISDISYLEVLIEGLENAERIDLSLDRNIRVLQPSQAEKQTQLPDEFYRYTSEELKEEQAKRKKNVENQSLLMTKEMREKRSAKDRQRYRYTLIRIRFPDGNLLQGTFSVYETYEDVLNFFKSNLCDESIKFSLLPVGLGHKVMSDDSLPKTLMDLHLVPAVVLIFHPEMPATEDNKISSYIKLDIAALMQNL